MSQPTPRANPTPGTGLRLSEVISALSHALDLTDGQPAGHSVRCCYIGMRIGLQMGLGEDVLSDLYYTLLLKDAGCSSNAARLCELYATDDIRTKRDVKTVDLQSVRQVGRFVLSHTGLGAGPWQRFKLLWNMLRNGDRIAGELVQARCERGADIARQLGFGQRVADGIQSLDEHHNGRGRPLGLRGDAIPLSSRIALLAQVVDVFHHVGGPRNAREELARRRGTWFDPALVDIALATMAVDDFWAGLADPAVEVTVLALEPTAAAVLLDDARMDAIAAGFGRVIDAKSPYTSGHSTRVADFCAAMCDELGVSPERRRWIHRAGLLHDIGKLGVSNLVLDKPGKLDEAEWAQMRQHPLYTFQILSRMAPFREMARIAGAHHERLDGGGYPWGLRHDEIPLETRIITIADIWDAISADRPYRRGMPLAKALEVMEGLRGDGVDPVCLDALLRTLPDRSHRDAQLESLQSLVERAAPRPADVV